MSEHRLNVHRLYQNPRLGPEPLAAPRDFRLHPEPEELDEPDFDLRALFRVFLARRWTIVGTVVACMTLAAIALVQMTPLLPHAPGIAVQPTAGSTGVCAELFTTRAP